MLENTLDLRNVICFGWEKHPKDKCWYNLSIASRANGWNNINIKQLEKSLTQNINNCYFYLVKIEIADVKDDTHYICFFNNQKSLWEIQIKDSPKANLDPDQMKDIFDSDFFKKIALRSYDIIIRAYKEFNENLKNRLEDGQLLDVDEIKLDAILDYINQEYTIENLKLAKYSK